MFSSIFTELGIIKFFILDFIIAFCTSFRICVVFGKVKNDVKSIKKNITIPTMLNVLKSLMLEIPAFFKITICEVDKR
jgi:hypothetical protein